MATASQVAKYLLSLADSEAGDLVSNLKLQKLLYYCQGASLAIQDRPLFDDNIFAWEHGPVVPSVWREYTHHGYEAIRLPEGENVADPLTENEQEVVKEVFDVFGQFSAWKLRNMTHAEPPWQNTDKNEVIPHEMMREYFKTLLVDGQEA